MIDLLILAAALAQTPQAEPLGLQITTVTKLANGTEKLGGMFFIPHPIHSGDPIYYFAKPGVCDGFASSQAPTRPEFGWQVEVVSAAGAAPKLKWSRLDGAAARVAPMNGTNTLPKDLPAFRNVQLDVIDKNLPDGAGCGAVSYSLVARYAPAFRHGATQSPATRSAGVRFVARIAYPDGRIEDRTVKTVTGDFSRAQAFYVSVPPSVCEGLTVSDRRPSEGKAWYVSVGSVKYAPESRARVRGEVMISAQDSRVLRNVEMVALPTQTTQRSADIVSVTGLKPVNGCDAVSVTLQGRLLPEPVEVKAEQPARLMEAELWFVHRAPDGKETSTRQALRLRGGTRTNAGSLGEFYFDDLVVNANVGDRIEPVTVEVFGSMQMYPSSDNGDISVGMQLTRRYVNPKAVALGIPPTVGKGTHNLTLQPGEVVSFVLPPVEGDKGHFLGHRFSVRLRLKPVSPEGN